MDLLGLLANVETAETEADLVGAIRPGTRLTFAGYCDWPDATLTVVSVRPATTPKGLPTHIIRTASEHPGQRWSS